MRAVVIVVTLCLGAAWAWAGGLAVAELGAVAGGTAGAGTARDGDVAAAWYNPAALADNHGWRVGVGLLLAAPVLSAHASDGSWQADAEAQISTPPHAYMSWSGGNRVVGVAISVPYGGGVSWPANWEGRFEIVSSQMEFVRLAPFYGWRLGNLRLAAGLHLDLGRMRLSRKLDFIDAEGQVDMDLLGAGLGVDGSLYWRARPNLDLGVVIKSRTRAALTGNADFTVPDSFSHEASDQTVQADIVLPDRIALGARWRRGSFSALADLEMTVWDVYDELVFDFSSAETTDVRLAMRWNSTVSLRAGAEWELNRFWTVRAGAFVDPSPAPAETLAPSSPDSTRVGLTLGFGRKLGAWNLDCFFEHMQILERSSTSADSLDAAYGGIAELLGVGVSYRP